MLSGNDVTLDVNPSAAVAAKAYLYDNTNYPTQSLRGKVTAWHAHIATKRGIGWGSMLQLSGTLCRSIRLFHCTSESNAATDFGTDQVEL
jgi:hypothetical protein